MLRWGMVIDLFRCIGCHACTYACKAEHRTGKGVFWTLVYDYERGKYPNVMRSFLPILCMHCKDAPCAQVCPSGATYQRADGIIAVDPKKCISCKACMVACPYHVRFKNPEDAYLTEEGHQEQEHAPLRQPGIIEKCDFCKDRIEQGKKHGLISGRDWDANPACVNACPVNARTFGDLNDQESEVSKLIRSQKGDVLHEELGTGPAVFYISAGKPLLTRFRTG
jgi:phenylacetyl-CoA:acceptor oxidoreductase 27-kDa subunit